MSDDVPMVWVTNHSKGDHVDSYGGVTYSFRMGETVEMPLEAAQALLGYGDRDKVPYVVRLGWSHTTNDLPHALKRLESFEISETAPQSPRSLSPAVEQVPLPGPRGRAGGKNTANAAA